MNNFLLFCIAIAIFLVFAVIIFLFFIWTANKTLIRGGSTWSAKKMPISHKDSSSNYRDPRKGESTSMLESISKETNEYLNLENKGENK